MSSPSLLLVVGDDPLRKQQLGALLLHGGFEAHEASPGEAPGDALNKGCALVVLDLRGPEASGLRALRALRALPAGAILPVLVVLDEAGLARLSQVYEAGASDFVCEPLSGPELVARVQALLDQARRLESMRPSSDGVVQAHRDAEQRGRRTERYAALFESAADGIAVFDAEARLLFANPKALSLCGASGLPLNMSDFLIKEEQPMLAKLRRGFRAGHYPHGVDLRLRRSDGPVLIVSANFSALADGVVLATFRDVTIERAIEQELRKTKGFLESVIESSADGIISADLKGNVLLFNRAAERCFGYVASEVVGKLSVEALYPAGGARQIMRLVRARGGRLENHRTDMLTRSGERFPVSLAASLVHEGGKVTGSVGVFSDLRERLRIESRLAAVQEELKLREKQSIIAELAGTMAHELNQPLTGVMGYAELLKRKLPPDSPALGTAEIIVGEVARMAEIIRKIGAVTRYETKSYVGQAKILDLDRASRDPAEDTLPPPSPSPPSTIPPSSPRSAS